MSVLQYQNPVTVDAVLDSVSLGGSPELRREILVLGDSAGANVTLVAGRVPVDGSGVTQPVSISGSVPVTGTFFQATQPVSIAASVAVTGTFFQATQPVSIAAAVDVSDRTARLLGNARIQDGSGNALTSTGSALDVNLKTSSITLPVSLASTTITGTVAVTQSTSPWVVSLASTTITGTVSENLTQVGGAAVSLGTKTSANSIPVVLASDEATLPVSIAATVNVSVQNATLAVTQSTSPWVVQDTAAEASLTTIASDLGTIPLGLTFIQAVVSGAGTAISTLDKVFVSPVTKGNVLLLMAMESGAAIPTWAKSAGTGTVQSLGVIKSSATAPGFSLQAWLVTGTGTLTMTTTSGGGASVDMAAYAVEIQGAIPAGVMSTSIPWWDSIQVSQGTAASFAFTPFYTETIGELPFLFIGVGSAATIPSESLGDAIMVASASNATTGGAGNLQLFSAARPVNAAPYLKMGNLSPTITFSGSTLYTAVYISLRPYQLSIAGSVTSNLNRVGGNLVTTAASGTQLVGNADGVGNALTSNSTTPAAHFALDSNITSILGTAPTTVGKLDVKGADGDVFVRQATAANLNATVVPGGAAIFEVSPTTAANTNANPFFNSITDGTTKVTVIAATAALKTDLSSVAGTATSTAAAGVQKVGVVGNTGAVFDAVTTAATTPANGIATLVSNVTTAPSLTTGQSVAVQGDYQGSVFVKPYRRGQTVSQATTLAVTGANKILPAQAAGIFADISNLIITVTPAAGAVVDVAFTASLSDGTKTFIFDLDTGQTGSATVGGSGPTGLNVQFNPPLAATTAATAWTINLSAAQGVHITVNAVLQKAS